MSLLTGLIFRLENGTISFSCLIPSSWGCMEVEQTLALCRTDWRGWRAQQRQLARGPWSAALFSPSAEARP